MRNPDPTILRTMSEAQDLGVAVHYMAVTRGTPVISSDGVAVGKVRKVADNFAEHILDGVEVEAPGGTVRFIDAPEVQRTFERGVTLGISAEQFKGYGPVKPKNPLAEVASGKPGRGGLGRLFGRRR